MYIPYRYQRFLQEEEFGIRGVLKRWVKWNFKIKLWVYIGIYKLDVKRSFSSCKSV
jgi:hypothetical protein